MKANVKTALNKRGGYREVYSRDGEGPILFEIKFRNDKIEGETQPLITYRLEIGFENGLPIITTEILSYRRGGYGRPYRFLDFHRGEGTAIINEDEYSSSSSSTFQDRREQQTLDSPDILAIKGLGQFQKFKAISSFRRLLDDWYVSNFQIQEARNVEDVGFSEHLSTSGNNLAQVTRYIWENHRNVFNTIWRNSENVFQVSRMSLRKRRRMVVLFLNSRIILSKILLSRVSYPMVRLKCSLIWYC